jgi:tRNA-intron lyase
MAQQQDVVVNSSTEPLPVFLANDNQCIIYDPQTVLTLHSKYRLVLRMIGSLPYHSSQNLYHSMPALLFPDAVTLALRNNWITIKKQLHKEEEQQQKNEDDGRKKRLKIMNAYEQDIPVINEYIKPHLQPSGLSEAMFILPNQSDERFSNEAHWIEGNSLWKYPETEKDRNRYKVFESLYNKGYFVTNGDRFGCDFLVYKEDPLIYHSEFMVYVVSEKDTWKPFPMISISRLGNYVQKTVLYACVTSNEETKKEQVRFLSLNWFDIEPLKLYRSNKKKQQAQISKKRDNTKTSNSIR